MDEGDEEEESGGPKVCRQCRAKAQLRSFDTRPEAFCSESPAGAILVTYISPGFGVDGGHVCWLSPLTCPGPVLWVVLTPWEPAQPEAEGLEMKAPGSDGMSVSAFCSALGGLILHSVSWWI